MTLEYSYTITQPGGLAPSYTIKEDNDDFRPHIVLGDKVLAYSMENDDPEHSETLWLLGTTTTQAGGETVFATREWDLVNGACDFGLYVYAKAGGPVVAAVGFAEVWEVGGDGTQTVVPTVEAIRGYMVPTEVVHNESQTTFRVYSYGNGIWGPEDGQLWVPYPLDDERPALPVHPGLAQVDPANEVTTELPGDPPYTVEVRLDAGIHEGGMYFALEFDPELETNLLPEDFWNDARFYCTMGGGAPPGVTTRLVANFEGSTLDIAGDGIGDGHTIPEGSGFVASAGYQGGYESPYYWLVPEWTVDTLPVNLADQVEECWIEGDYVFTPLQPFRQTGDRSNYSFIPASDMLVTTPETAAWGAPETGAGRVQPRTSWARFGSKHWTAIAANWQRDHYPYGGPEDQPYELERFTIAIRFDEAVGSTITSELDLSRCRFT